VGPCPMSAPALPLPSRIASVGRSPSG
jgi:hypothetical protein